MNPAVVSYDTRRCNVCQGGKAYWGFGSPLTAVEVWSCEMHLSETESRLTKKPMVRNGPPSNRIGRLL